MLGRGPLVVAASATAGGNLVLPPPQLAAAKLLYAASGAPAHFYPGHSETPERVPAILKALQAGGLTAEARPGELVQLTGFAPATFDDVAAVHAGGYIKVIEKLSGISADCGETRLVDPAPTFVTGTTASDAYKAAGAVIALVDNVVAASRQREAEAASGASSSGGVPAAFAICRPPGHHCIPTEAMGFCIFGNAAIAARYAQRAHGLKKVLIYDFDVHHGNGTQDVFERDPDVLFISSHRSGFYPGTGRLEEVGVGEGEGATINLPLPGLSGHAAALEAFDAIVAPAARRFRPDLIIVSAGYDAHWNDPLGGLQAGGLQFRSLTYHALGARLKALADELCGGRMVALLEGGYDLDALGESVVNTWRGILGEDAADAFNAQVLQPEPMHELDAVLREAARIHGL